MHTACLEESLQHLTVGRIVDRREGDAYAHDEFLVNNYVYKPGRFSGVVFSPIHHILTVAGIAEDEEHDEGKYLHHLYESSSWFSGAAAEKFVRRGNEKALSLARHTELIVAKKAVVEELPKVSLMEVAQCNGGEDENGYNEAWIAIGAGTYSEGLVYTVTSMSPFP